MTAYSMPIHLRCLRAPHLVVEESAGKLDQGGKTEIPVRINRLYGFADAVELTLVVPKSASGLSAAKVTLPKDQSQATLVVEAGRATTPGEHKVTLQASLKFNNQDLKADQPVTVKVEAAEQPKS